MDRKKTARLNFLFEKMTNNVATISEQVELKHLYEEYIYEGRDIVITPTSYLLEKNVINASRF